MCFFCVYDREVYFTDSSLFSDQVHCGPITAARPTLGWQRKAVVPSWQQEQGIKDNRLKSQTMGGYVQKAKYTDRYLHKVQNAPLNKKVDRKGRHAGRM